MTLGFRFFECVKNHSSGLFGPHYPKTLNSKTFLSQTQFGWITTVILFAILLEKDKSLNRIKKAMDARKICDVIWATVCFLLFLAFSPLFLVVITGFWFLKRIDEVKLRKIQNSNFKNFLSGVDSVWACEDDFSRSIINVLAFVEANKPQNLLQSLRDRVSTAILSKNRFPKMFYRRVQSDFGCFYWTDENILMIDDYIRFADCDSSGTLKEDIFKKQMSRISNLPLPADNSALWECLVGQQFVQCCDDLKLPVSCLHLNNHEATQFFNSQVIFRFHHSLGDGTALLRLLLECVDVDDRNKDLSFPSFEESWREKLKISLIYFAAFLKTPHFMVTTAFKKRDSNRIHPKELSGNKVKCCTDNKVLTDLFFQKVNWIYESSSNAKLLAAVKTAKTNFKGARFGNILLAALSRSLKDFLENLEKRKLEIPEDITVVLPARLLIEKDYSERDLLNRFSVGVQSVPIDVEKTSELVQKIKENFDDLMASPDYIINYWLMSKVFQLVPARVIKQIIKMNHSTMVVSNLPGPDFPISINGHTLEDIGFFIPNLGQTAIGVTVFSYDNKLNIGMLTDDAAIETEDDIGCILNGMVREIEAIATIV